MTSTGPFQFRDQFYSIPVPPWLRTGNGEKYMYTLELCRDLLCEKAFEAMTIRLPGVGDPSNLPYLAFDRNLQQGPAETNESFAARLTGAGEAWGRSGSAEAVLEQLQAYLSNLQPGLAASLPLCTIVGNPTNTSPSYVTWTQLYQGDAQGAPATLTTVSPGNFSWSSAAGTWWRWLILPMALAATGLSGAIAPSPNWFDAVGVGITGQSMTKTGAIAGWNAGAATVGTLAGDGSVSFTTAETNTDKMAGLSHIDPAQDFTKIDFALFLTSAGAVSVYEAGVFAGTFGTYAANDVFRVQVVGSTVTYYQNGSLLYTSANTPTHPLLFGTSLYTPGATINAVSLAGTAATGTAASSACFTSPGQNVGGVWVPATSGTPVNAPWLTVTGLSGLAAAQVGQWLTLSGSIHAGNNGTFPIVEVLGPTSCVIANPQGVASDAGPLTWSIGTYPFIGPGPAWGAPGYVFGQGELVAPAVDTGANVGGVWQPSLPAGATSQPTISWGLNCRSAVIVSIRGITKLWKSAGTYYPNIVVAFDCGTGAPGAAYSPNSGPGSGNPDGSFGSVGKNIGGVWVPTRLIYSPWDAYCQGTGIAKNCSVENMT